MRPFRAVRPAPGLAARVASPPYDVPSVAEARAEAGDDPASFLLVTRAEIELPPGTDPHADVVYERARNNFRRMLEDGVLIRDPEPALYAYRLRQGAHVQHGVAATFAIDESEDGTIKPHERTRRDKEDDRTHHIDTVAAQTGPVLLAYPAVPAIDAAIARVVAQSPPLYDFPAAGGVAHTLWALPADIAAAVVEAFALHVPALYIADGHHRARAAARDAAAWRRRHPDAGADADRNFFLAVAFPHHALRILPYNRLVRDLGGRTPAEFLTALAGRAAVRGLRAGGSTPPGPGHIAMYLAGRWHAFELVAAQPDDPVQSLDTAVLQAEVLAPILGITDPRADARIDFVGGVRGPEELARRVDAGDAAVAFALHPLGMDALFRVADAGAFLPPKSTWFEPKLRDGLLVHAFEA